MPLKRFLTTMFALQLDFVVFDELYQFCCSVAEDIM